MNLIFIHFYIKTLSTTIFIVSVIITMTTTFAFPKISNCACIKIRWIVFIYHIR